MGSMQSVHLNLFAAEKQKFGWGRHLLFTKLAPFSISYLIYTICYKEPYSQVALPSTGKELFSTFVCSNLATKERYETYLKQYLSMKWFISWCLANDQVEYLNDLHGADALCCSTLQKPETMHHTESSANFHKISIHNSLGSWKFTNFIAAAA